MSFSTISLSSLSVCATSSSFAGSERTKMGFTPSGSSSGLPISARYLP